MPVIKMTAQKMSDADVKFISLVKRGANRIPFKVVKQEKEMSKGFSGLDLGAFFARKSEKKIEPTIVGVVTLKGEGFESIKSQIAEAGFSVENMAEMEDGSVVFKQADVEGDETVIRLNDHIAMVTKGFSPYNMELGGDVSFAEAAAARGFYPGISSIMSTLTDMVDSTVRKSESPADAQKMVSKVFQEASGYINSFLSGLPAKAFKLELVSPDAVVTKGDETAPAEGETTEAAAVEKGDGETTTQETQAAEAAPAAETPVEKQEEQGEKALTAQEVADIVQTTVEARTSDLVTKMDKLTEALAGITASINGIQGSVETFGTRVEAAESVAKAAQEAVTGTVVAGVQGNDGTQVIKSDREYVGKEIDTAFMPRRQATRR